MFNNFLLDGLDNQCLRREQSRDLTNQIIAVRPTRRSVPGRNGQRERRVWPVLRRYDQRRIAKWTNRFHATLESSSATQPQRRGLLQTLTVSNTGPQSLQKPTFNRNQ